MAYFWRKLLGLTKGMYFTPAAKGSPPAAPVITPAVLGPTSISTTWPSVPGATSYNGYYRTPSGSGPYTEVMGVTSPWVLNTVGFTYDLYVEAVNAAGSTNSAVSTVNVLPRVGWWKLNEGSGIVAIDSSANGNNGSLVNAPAYSTTVPPLVVPPAFSLNLVSADSQYVNVPDAPAIRLPGTGFSISFWVKTSVSNAIIIEKYNGNIGDASYQIYQPPTGGWYLHSGTGTVDATTNIADGNWHNLVATFDGTTAKMYTDGNLEGSGSFSLGGYDAEPLTLGARASGEFGMTGLLSWVQFFDSPLTQAQVSYIAAGNN